MNAINTIFNPRRFFRVALLDLAQARRPLLIAAACIAAACLLIHVGNDANGSALFPVALNLTGFLITAAAFHELHDKNAAMAWLLLPASCEEKFLSRALLSSAGVAVAVTVLVALASLLSGLSAHQQHGIWPPVFNPFTAETGKSLAWYLVAQSVFFAGAAVFRKHAFMKTVLVIALAALVLAMGSAWVMQTGLLDRLPRQMPLGAGYQLNLLSGSPMLDIAGKVIWWGILTPAMWVLAYWRVRRATA